ncbi:MAG TPA: hypothetical protein PKL15_18900, partial [Saprospiraceae bacterium]|nr:hypothetical protein [Saprospiraceae bacterium]
MLVSDAQGNQWQRTVETTLRRRQDPPVLLYPSGDIRLPRFKSKRISYQGIPPGDTLRCIVKSTAGSPFKLLALHFNDTLSYTYRNADSLAYFQCPPAGSFTLQLQAKPALSRQIASISVSRIPPQRFDTLVNTTDVLLKAAGDSLSRPTWRSNSVAGLQTAWYGSLPTGRPGEQLKRKKELIVQPRQAQKSRLSPSGVIRVKKNPETRLVYRDFLPGDTLLFYAKCRGKGVFASASLVDQDSNQFARALNTPEFQSMVVAGKEQSLSLLLKPRWRLKKTYADVAVTRIRPMPSDSFYQITDSLFRSTTQIIYDTTGLSILDDSLRIAPLWNLEAEPMACLQVDVPPALAEAGELEYIAYWYGPDAGAVTQYRLLEASVPATWSLPGLPPALGAYALGRNVALPEGRLPELESGFVSNGQKALFLQKKSWKRLFATFPNAGKINAAELQKWGL